MLFALELIQLLALYLAYTRIASSRLRFSLVVPLLYPNTARCELTLLNLSILSLFASKMSSRVSNPAERQRERHVMPASDLHGPMPNSYQRLSTLEDILISNLTPVHHDDDVEHRYLLDESWERGHPDDKISVRLNGSQISNRASIERINTFQMWWKELGL